jgi:Uma2 family endonuclease
LLSGIDWKTYSRLLHLFAECPSLRLTYDRGELEMSLRLMSFDGDGRVLCVLMFILTEELGLPLKHGGSTTLRLWREQRGIEADESFWIAGAPQMAGRRRLDLKRDPPPDLAVEADVNRGSLDRLGIYASLGVPEVWRLEGDVLTFHVLGTDGTYAEAATSRSFPFLKSADVLLFLQEAREASDQNVVTRKLRGWVRKQRPGKKRRRG